MTIVALIQESPSLLNKERSIVLAVDLINKASDKGAQLIVFPEAFLPGYPAWIWRLRPGSDWDTCEELHKRLRQNSINLSKNDLLPLQEAAKHNDVTIVCGINEIDHNNSQATLFNATVTINTQGLIVNHHRKLMPTNPERMVWGFGDGHGINVTDTASGRIGNLICWENYMPLARYTLYAQGVEIYIAPTYDSGQAWINTMQHIARESRCWVLSCGVALERKDLPGDFPDKDELYPIEEEWINPGDSLVVSPNGEIVAGPLSKEKGIVLADIDIEAATSAKRALDVSGHYARPDIFTLEVNKERQSTIKFKQEK